VNKLNILIVDDEHSQREMLRGFLMKEGYIVEGAESGEKGIAAVRNGNFDLILLDYKMPGMNGIEVLKEVKHTNPHIDIIMMTAHGSLEIALQAMKAGAVDYFTKPIQELEVILMQINKISERRNIIRENEILRQELQGKGVTTDQIKYISSAMENLVNMAGRVAASRATVLIQGESGTGKELLARLIHHLSPRSGRPMVAVNCGAIPETLLEAELFGHEKGAFTGAAGRRIGRFEEADGSTLFLDEVGDLTPPVQVKLLRFLQEREFQRLGGNQTVRADVRVISATNRDLEKEVRGGAFREDLYYRLNVVVMTVPPLRERKEDIPLLIESFLKRYARATGKEIRDVSWDARKMLMKYDYPGNVRELENIIERAVVISRGSVITLEDLPFRDRPLLSESKERGGQPLKDSVESLESWFIEEAMRETQGNQTRAAELLGISERMLRYKLKKYGFKH